MFLSGRVTSIRPGRSQSLNGPRQGCRTYGSQNVFLGRGHQMLLFFFFFFFLVQRFYMVNSMCIYIHISDCVEILYGLPSLTNNTMSEIFLQKSGAVRSVD
jgi:hypothetical protein